MKASIWLKRAALVCVALSLLAIGVILGSGFTTATVTAQDESVQTLTEIEQIYADIYNRVSPSVVSIETYQRSGNGFVLLSTGSGFVIDDDGYIATNNHVIDGGDRIAINFLNGTIVRADVVGLDPDSDLAVLHVDLPSSDLVPVTFADSNQLVVGQTALAIGSPFGERWTLTTGIVSALDRTITGLTSFRIGAVVQTDTAINPGNSGGPLLNLRGEVVGVNSQIINPEARANSGVGFAIPSNLVVRVAEDLVEDGEVNYSYLGMDGEDMNLDFIEFYGMPNNLRGVVVTNVRGGGPADDGGLRALSNNSVDVIVAINREPILNFSELVAYIATNTRPGDDVTMTIWRDGREVDLNIELGERP